MQTMPTSPNQHFEWGVFVQMRGVLCQIGNEYQTGQKQGFSHARCNCKISQQSWTSRNIGIRKPELGETPLSMAEMEFAWKKGLI
jgi:hypothetical protein